jgi:hypothetical protein
MPATGNQGIDVRQSANRLVFRALLQDSAGAIVTTGTTTLRLYELQDDGTLKSYDFSSNTFKTTALTTETLSMTHRTGNNGTTNTGLWTGVLSTLTGFTVGAIIFAQVLNSGASPAVQASQFQFGGAEGDLQVTSTFFLKVDTEEFKGGTIPTPTTTGVPRVEVHSYLTGQDPATLVLATPANKLVTDGTGRVTVGTNADKTGYSLTQSFPANFATLVIDGNGRVDVSKWLGGTPNALTSGNLPSLVNAYAAGQDPRTLLEVGGGYLDTLITRLSATRTAYLDNLNTGGIVASQADINALNQSASRRILLAVVPAMERPESGNNTYTVEMRLFTADGVAVNADSTPTISPVGKITGSLSANMGALSNPATGVYRGTYTVASSATLEEIRFDGSALVSAEGLTLSTYTAVGDFVSAVFTTTDSANILAAKVAAEAAKLRAETGIPNATPGTTNGLPLKSDLPVAPDNAGITNANTKLDTLTTRIPGVVQPQTGDAYARLGAPTGASVSADIAGVQTKLGTPAGASVSADVATITSRLGTPTTNVAATLDALSGKFAGITLMANWMRLPLRKTNNDPTAISEVNANNGTGTGTFDPTTDSGEAIRDRGDVAWTGGGGGAAPTVAEIAAEIERTGGMLEETRDLAQMIAGQTSPSPTP